MLLISPLSLIQQPHTAHSLHPSIPLFLHPSPSLPLTLPLPLFVPPLSPLCLEVTEHRIWDSCHIEASGTISMAIAQNEDAIAFSVCSKAPCPVYIAHYCGLCILSIKLHSLNQKVI